MRALLLLLCLLLCACQTQIYTGLDEKQANAMLALLLKRGVQVEKINQGKTGYAIAVDEAQVVFALQVLADYSLPRDNFATLGTVFAGGGMIASAQEEQARMTWALSQELANTFSRIDGVLTARVHVVLGINDAVNNVKIPPSATVFLRHMPESIVTTLVTDIRKATASAVAGLNFDNVTVMLVPVRESVTIPMAPKPPASLLGVNVSLPLILQTSGLALGFAALGLGLGYLWQRRKYKKAQAETPPEQTAQKA
ncbi:MAG: type III secretion inner membrane ring lipoprotein SctJ [Desulfovibrionaceae bacterium]|nr:type III secretion inner membrane ring lipoprotein SctJ [Desulfovibrionaceae bacterium]